jgi:PAS domain S-box-containing protein
MGVGNEVMSSTTPTPDGVHDLRRCVRDLVAVSTLPAVWENADRSGVGRGLGEVLLRILSADFVYVRLNGRDGGPPLESLRTRQRAESEARAREVGKSLEPWLGFEDADAPPTIPSPVGQGVVRLSVLPIGHGQDYGLLAAGCGRADFPTDTERPLLGVAVNQAAGLLQRKEVEEELRRQSEWQRVTLASIGDAVITTDTEGRVTSLNSVAESLTGWTSQDARGVPLDRVFHIVNEQTRRAVENPAARALRDGQIVGLANHTVLIARDGTERAIDDSAAPIKDEQGHVIGCVLVFRDVTERRRLEKQTIEQAEAARKLAAIVDSSEDAIISKTLGGIIQSWNAAAERIFGYAADEAVGRPITMLFPADRLDEEERIIARIRSGERVEHFDTVRLRKDGTAIPISLTISPIKDGEGRIMGASKIARDITERKRAEAALRQSEERLTAELEAITRLHALSIRLLAADNLTTALQDVLENAIVTVGADFGNIQLYNAKIEALEIVAQRGFRQDFLEYFRTVRIDEGSACAQAMQNGQRIIIEDVNLDPSYEPHRQIAATAGYRAVQSTPLKTHDGAILGMLSTHFRAPHRVSDRDQRLLDLYARHAADLIERLRFEQALKDGDRRKDEFLATLAHELRNPLAPIRNAVQIFRAKGSPVPELQWARDVIDRQVEQMTRLVDDLLDVSRITRGKIDLRKERVELATVVNNAVEGSRPLIEKWGHELTVKLPSEPVYLDADLTRLAQVLLNLLNNAAKYTEQGGRIWLTAEKDGGQVVIRVKDTGIGIPQEMLPRIFEMFTQVDRSLERSQGGLGIGLTLVQSLVEMHGGTVKVHSDGPGKGSEFVVRLPLATQAEDRGAQGTTGDRPAAAPAKCRILVVDDNQDSADSLAMLLRIMGNEVHTAHDGLEAVGAAGVFRPDVVVLDIGLPKLNGYEAGRRIREQQGEDVVLIALTGWGQEEDRRRSKEAGFNYHMTKPVEFDALQKVLAELKSAAS